MNPIDYLLLGALAAGALYTFYRLFVGYAVTRWHGAERAADVAEYPKPSRTENAVPDFKR